MRFTRMLSSYYNNYRVELLDTFNIGMSKFPKLVPKVSNYKISYGQSAASSLRLFMCVKRLEYVYGCVYAQIISSFTC